MKNVTLPLVIALSVLILGVFLFREHPVAGQDKEKARAEESKKDKHHLSTTGTATVRVQPNSARVYLQVETMAKTIQQARLENATITQKVLDAVKNLKIPGWKMKTSNIQVTLVQSRVDKEEHLPVTLGYRVQNTFTVLVEEGDRQKLSQAAGQVLDTSLENGATTVQQIEFFRKDMSDVHLAALTQATEVALKNAEAIAKGAHKKILDVITISDTPEFTYTPQMLNNINFAQVGGGGGGPATTSPVAIGDLEVTCRVNVTCLHD